MVRNKTEEASLVSCVLPATLSQQTMVAQSLTTPHTGNGIGQFSCMLTGTINEDLFSKSWSVATENLLMLFTNFFMEDTGEIVQNFIQPILPPLEYLNWKGLNKSKQTDQFIVWQEKDRIRGFDVSAAPLIRCTVIQFSVDSSLIVLSFHNAMLDEISIAFLAKDLFTVYNAYLNKVEPYLPERTKQFFEMLLWKKNYDTSDSTEFWQQQVISPVKHLELKCRQVSTSGISKIVIKKIHATISSTNLHDLHDVISESGLTLQSLVHAAWSLVLYQYTDREDLVFGSVRKCRDIPVKDINAATGMLVNTVPFFISIDGKENLQSFIYRIQEKDDKITQHEYTSIDEIRKLSNIDDGISLFETLVMFRKPNWASLFEFNSTEFYLSDFSLQGQTGLPIALIVTEENGIHVTLEYNENRFSKSVANDILQNFISMLSLLPTYLNTTIGEINFLGSAQQDLLHQWNSTDKEYEEMECLHHFFEAAVDRTPDAIALVFEDTELTYQQLEVKANQLAHYLRKLGVTAEQPVAILMDRSIEMVIALYAVLKAGGAYLPLDPEHPSERLNTILEEACPQVLLTQTHLTSKINLATIKILALDQDWLSFNHQPKSRPTCTTTTSNLAYVIYTSGSTGKPKGVMNEHRGICNRLQWMQEAYSLTKEDSVLQKTPYTFDVSVWEFFWPLMVGARLVISKPGGHRDSLYLLNIIEQQQITTLHFVPSMLNVFLEIADSHSCGSLRRVFCSGEALPKALQDRYFSYFSAPLYNLYGPTEAAVDVTHWTCQRESNLPFVPIGFPIANTSIYILNCALQHVPIGVAGELYIGGIQVARGYLAKPELTSESFLKDPFKEQLEARMYKTGDLARFLPDGSVEYLGREDFQVKLNGLRIELAEIEAALVSSGDIKQAVVICEESKGYQHLIAYVVPQKKQSDLDLEQDLRQWLKKFLPIYMIPQHYILLEAMPLSANGKLDKSKLPQPSFVSHNDYIAPGSKIEKKLSAIWSRLLDIEQISIIDNFFDIGGTSLLGIELFAIINNTFNLEEEIEAVALYQFPTIQALASHLNPRESVSKADISGKKRASRQKSAFSKFKKIRN